MSSVQHDRVTAEHPGSCRAGQQLGCQREEFQALSALPVAAGERHMAGSPFPRNRHWPAPEVSGIPAGTYLVAPKAAERSRRSRAPAAPSCDLLTNASVSVPSSPPVLKKTFPFERSNILPIRSRLSQGSTVLGVATVYATSPYWSSPASRRPRPCNCRERETTAVGFPQYPGNPAIRARNNPGRNLPSGSD